MTRSEAFMFGMTAGTVLTWLAFIIGEWRSERRSGSHE
jgi:hypothetical protein